MGVIKDNYYRLERAIIDTYINVAFSGGGAADTNTSKKRANTAPSSETLEFSKLFNKIKIDCNLDPDKHDIKALTEKVKQSRYLKGFSKISDILNKYNDIISDKYKDFSKPDKNNKVDGINKKPTKREYTEKDLKHLYDVI